MKKSQKSERVTFMLIEEELIFLKSRAQQSGFSNFSEFLRVMVFNNLKGFNPDFRGE